MPAETTARTAVLVLLLAGCRTKDQADGPPVLQPRPEPISVDQADTPLVERSLDGPPLTREEIRVVVRAKMSQVRACFDAGLAEQPEIGGRVLLRFSIAASGRAGPVEIVEDELGVASVATCLSEAVQSWQFPLPRGGAEMTITYPFVFSSEDSLRAAGLPRVEGTVKPAAVGAVFEARGDELDSCVPAAGKGTIGLAFTIDDAGAVTRISTYANSFDEHARACVIRTVSSWAFPPAADGDLARVNHDLWW